MFNFIKCRMCGIGFDSKNGHEVCLSCYKKQNDQKRPNGKRVQNEKKLSEFCNDLAKDRRSTAKLFGAKALTGTAKQKAVAEKIRSEFLELITSDVVLNWVVDSKTAGKSSFWLDTKDVNRTELHDAIAEFAESTERANEIGMGNTGYQEQLTIRAAAVKKMGL